MAIAGDDSTLALSCPLLHCSKLIILLLLFLFQPLRKGRLLLLMLDLCLQGVPSYQKWFWTSRDVYMQVEPPYFLIMSAGWWLRAHGGYVCPVEPYVASVVC